MYSTGQCSSNFASQLTVHNCMHGQCSSNFASQLAMYSAGQWSSNFASQLAMCIALVRGHLISPVN